MMRGSSVLMMVPNPGVPYVRLRPVEPARRLGGDRPALMLLVRLKASARNSSVYPSRIVTTREAAISNCQNAGAFTLLRPRLPKVPAAGAENAAGLIQQLGFGLAHNEFDAI